MKLNTRKLMIQYCILQGSYWASFCVVYAFATVFLLSRGFESSMIGVIIAAGNILGVILQPMVASIADRSEKISLHKLTAMLSIIMILLLVLLYFVPNGLLAVAVLFLLTDTFLQVIQPLINSVSVYYVNQGVSVDFGSARGIGSLSYAVASYILGIVVEKFGTRSILMAGILVALVLLVTILSMPVLSSSAASRLGEKEPEQNDAGLIVFAGRYKNFMLTLAGITLLFTFHNMNNAYLIKVIENVGPDKNRTVSLRIVDENNPALPGREAVKVRGIYISGPMAGSTELFQNILDSAAGTEHPNPSSSGMNDRPLKPSARIGRSIRNAARAI